MKKLMLTMALLAATMSAMAAEEKLMMPLAGAMAANGAQARLGDSVKFSFGDQPMPRVKEKLGVDKTSQKTNAFRKANETVCNWVFLSAMLRLQERAKQLGANAVIHIVSNYDNVEMSSETEFECHVGAIMAGVALKGEFVKIAD